MYLMPLLRKSGAGNFSASLSLGRVSQTKLFGRLRNVDVVTPSSTEVDVLDGTYRRIVQEEGASTEDFARLRGLAHTLIDREQLDAILLAGTDLSFVFNPENTDFPHIDGARTHIDAIMRKLAA